MNVEQRLTAIRDLIQEDVGNRGLARDPVANLINACPDDFAAACRSIAAAERPSVVILTGFYIAHAEPPCGETDGPLGAPGPHSTAVSGCGSSRARLLFHRPW